MNLEEYGKLDYEWSIGNIFNYASGRGASVEDCVKMARWEWRNHYRVTEHGYGPGEDFAVRERGAATCKNWRPLSEWMADFGLRWPARPYALRDGSCGRCDHTVYAGHRQGDHWHCKCGSGADWKSFRWFASPGGHHIERGCAKCGEKIPVPGKRFVYGHRPGDPIPSLRRGDGDSGCDWSYPMGRARRIQAIKFALDQAESPELTGRALKLAEMRERLASGYVFVHGIYGAPDPGLGTMNEGQLMELETIITAKDRDNLRAFNAHARSMMGEGWDPRMGYSSSGG